MVSPCEKSGCERAERMRLRRTSGLLRKRRRTLPGRGQRGFVLIELLVSMAIFGVISVGFLSALVAGYHGVIVAHDQTMAAEPDPHHTSRTSEVRRIPVVGLSRQPHRSSMWLFMPSTLTGVLYDRRMTRPDLQMITVTVRYHESGKDDTQT